MLKANGLGHSYDRLLFSNLNLHFKKSTSTAILGSSGCGKSTLLHILSTMLKPDSGEVFYNDKSIYNLSEDERTKIRRYDFGIIFQQHYLFKGFSAYENIELASVLSKNTLDKEILQRLGIDKLLKNKVTKLSGGEQQRVSIARVLCKKPKVIFADEATGNLDQINARNILDIINEYIKENNGAFIFVTHDENLAKLCDTQIRLA